MAAADVSQSGARRRYEDRLDERCDRCGHTLADHHWNGSRGGRCCQEVDRVELCSCHKFVPTGGDDAAKAARREREHHFALYDRIRRQP